MTPRRLTLPLTEADAASLSLGDMILLDGPMVCTAGIPTHHRILETIDAGRDLPIDMTGGAFFHLGSYSRETDDGLEVLYMNPTTSTRFNALMPRIIRHLGLRCVGGKGGLDSGCAAALRDVGGVYLSFLGGGAPLHSEAIRRILRVEWNDMISHYRLVQMEVAAMGPLTVAIDAQGRSLYDDLTEKARDRREAILNTMRAERDG